METKALCEFCLDSGHVCENHPTIPWEGVNDPFMSCDCGGAGMPCQECCVDIPQDGSQSIISAFIPRVIN